MRCCVFKDTTTILERSLNPIDVMLQNALNCGYTSEQVEILTKEQYVERKSLEPIAPVPKSEIEILQEENKLLKAQAQANADRADFHEDLIVEMAMAIYQ